MDIQTYKWIMIGIGIAFVIAVPFLVLLVTRMIRGCCR